MKRSMLVLGFVLLTHAAFAQDHAQLVADTKAALEAKGASVSGACGAFQITTRVAWALRFEGAGLLDKSSGENCNGFAVAIVAYPNGKIVDMLYDAGNENRPQWLCCDTVDPARYRPAFDPADGTPPPVVNPPPVVPPPVVDDFAARVYAKLQELATHADILRSEDTTRNEAANTRTQEQRNADAAQASLADVQASIRPWKDVGLFVLKYIAPEVVAIYTTWRMAHQP